MNETDLEHIAILYGLIDSIVMKSERYRDALEHIAIPLVHDAEAQTSIARAALGLDGEA